MVGAAPVKHKRKVAMSSSQSSQSSQLRRMVKNLAKLGIPFDLAVILVADQMRVFEIPITSDNLDFAFS